MLLLNLTMFSLLRFLQGWYDIKTGLWKTDGLKDLKYTVMSAKQYPLYTWMLVDLDDSKVRLVCQFETVQRYSDNTHSSPTL